jgi:hypothetical protein
VQFDTAKWDETIKRPDWPVEFNKFAEAAKKACQDDEDALDELNKKARKFFEKKLNDNQVYLGTEGVDFDKERGSVDTIVIHHTSHHPGYKLNFLNAVQLLNIYVPAYAVPPLAGNPVYSGHYRGKKQVFWGYHWLMRINGKFERLLDDDQVGWQAGNWDINKRSIGICLPSDEILRKLAGFIKKNYPDIKSANIIGHREARSGTICPGANFLDGWKQILLRYVNDS